ncbi:MAG: hypothetical protein IPJ88_16495 [Myxococcales bacterium]|nr:MAG: hypothetical protein IPJ88_16495 [Myxococcales bacterium]
MRFIKHFPATVHLALLLAACGSSGSTLPKGSLGDEEMRELCEASGKNRHTVDVNNDGRVDISHYFKDGVERCVQYDMNYDGKIDATRFFDTDGKTPIREEHDFDFDGRIDQLTFFKHGKIERKELDTNFDNVIDYWVWCDGKAVSKTERDRYHNGRVDVWESYKNGWLTEVVYDDNNDGDPEKWEILRNGSVVEVRYDTDGDGKADRNEKFPSAAAGPPTEPMACEGGVLEIPEEEVNYSAPPATEAKTDEQSESFGDESPAESEQDGQDNDDAASGEEP